MNTQETRRSQILLSAALQAVQQGLYADSDKLFCKARDLSEKTKGTNSIEHAGMLVRYADFCADNGRMPMAETLYKEALPIYLSAHGHDHMTGAIVMRNLADLCSRQGKESEAQDWMQRSIQILSKHRASA